MIVVLFGQPGSGKSTLAKKLENFHNIDGDNFRRASGNTSYDKQGRIKNLNLASYIANVMHSNGVNVVLSFVYPYKICRDHLNYISGADNVKWVYLHRDSPHERDSFKVGDFETPTEEENVLTLNTSVLSVEDCVGLILSIKK